MCINCNLISPIYHEIADMLGIPRNKYGMIARTFDVLIYLLIDLRTNKLYNNDEIYKPVNKYETPEKWVKIIKLYNYLVDNNLFHYLEKLIEKNQYSSTNQYFINYILVKYFKTEYEQDETIINSFNVPLDLLSSEDNQLKKWIGTVTFTQIELIPDDIIQKYNVKEKDAIDYNIKLLPEQKFL